MVLVFLGSQEQSPVRSAGGIFMGVSGWNLENRRAKRAEKNSSGISVCFPGFSARILGGFPLVFLASGRNWFFLIWFFDLQQKRVSREVFWSPESKKKTPESADNFR